MSGPFKPGTDVNKEHVNFTRVEKNTKHLNIKGIPNRSVLNPTKHLITWTQFLHTERQQLTTYWQFWEIVFIFFACFRISNAALDCSTVRPQLRSRSARDWLSFRAQRPRVRDAVVCVMRVCEDASPPPPAPACLLFYFRIPTYLPT